MADTLSHSDASVSEAPRPIGGLGRLSVGRRGIERSAGRSILAASALTRIAWISVVLAALWLAVAWAAAVP